MNLRWLAIFLSVLVLSACGGSSTSSKGNTGTLSVFATDNITEQFSEVWVSVISVTAEDASDKTVTLFSNESGETINLATLANIGSLLSAQDLPAGTYDDFKVTISNDVRLVAKDGSVIDAAFSATEIQVTIGVPGSATIEAGQASAVAFDFDLKQFIYNAATGLVSPVVKLKDNGEVKQLERRFAQIEGTVVAVLSADSFTLQIEDSDTQLTVSLHAVAGIALASANGVIKDANLLAAGDEIEVFGNYDTDLLTIEAVRVQIEKSRGARLSAQDKVEGQVLSFDGSTLVIDVKQGSFLPESDTMTIANISNALFIHGGLDQLAANQWVEIRGMWDGTTFSAMIVDIEGADLEESEDEGEDSSEEPSSGAASAPPIPEFLLDNPPVFN